MFKLFWIIPALAMAPVAHAQSTSNIVINGNDQTVTVNQQNAVSATAFVQQNGNSNENHVIQRGSTDEYYAIIDGGFQRHQSEQKGGAANAISLNSFGTDNISSIAQDGLPGGVNEVHLLQNGLNNAANIEQYVAAGTNIINLVQSGNDNIATLAQNGSDNNLDLTQNGDANGATVTQIGSGLGFSLTQDGGAQIVVTQTSPGG